MACLPVHGFTVLTYIYLKNALNFRQILRILQVALLQEDLKAEVLVVEEKKARTFALIESIGQEKAVVDEAVESSRADEEDAAKLQVHLKA